MNDTRIAKLKEKIKEAEAESVVLFSQKDIFYFTQVDAEGVLVVTLQDVKLFVSPLYYEQSVKALESNVVLSMHGLEDVKKYLKKEGVHSIAIDLVHSTAGQYLIFADEFEVKDFSNVTLLLRMIKDKEEIKSIKRAAFTARNAFMKVFPYIKIGMSEKEIADDLTYQIRKAGAQKESFETIVAAGENAAYPHHIPTDKKVQNGEFLMIDFGVLLDGYNSDNTFTFLMGDRDPDMKHYFNAVFYAQLYATEMIIPGVTKVKEIEERARKELKKYNLDEYFIHSLGHGVGLDVHEFPYINLKNDMIVQPGMIFTIEPGIYMPGKLGIRLENMILVKENDVEVIAFTPLMEAI